MIVVVLNGLISLLCLYVAWRVWKLRRRIAAAADVIAAAEQRTYAVLHGAPKAIYKGQSGVHRLRGRYQQLELQLQQIQQALTLLGLVKSFWRFGARRQSVPEDLTSGKRSPLRRRQNPEENRRRR